MIVFPAMPVRNPCVSVVFHQSVFKREECLKLIETAENGAWEEAMVGGQTGFRRDEVLRCNRQQKVKPDQSGFPLDRILVTISQANSEGWRFELSGIVYDDMPWIMRYDEGGRGHNDWHVDIGRGANASRKLGYTLQLSSDEDYSGGDLEFHNMPLDPKPLRQQGTLIVFPAYWLHRVAPVTGGSRYALVGWVHGPSFS